MRRIVTVTAVIALVAVSSFALAGKGKKDKAAKAPPPDGQAADEAASGGVPEAGKCKETQAGIKTCATKDGAGVFEVRTYPPDAVLIRFEEPVVRVVPPPKKMFAVSWSEGDSAVIVAPLMRDFPDPTAIVISTGTVNVTVNLRPAGSSTRDTQLTVVNPGRDAMEAEIQRRVDERVAPLEADLAEQKKHLEAKADARAEVILLEELAGGGAKIGEPGGKGIARNDAFIVLRGQQVVRVGSRYYLVFTVENRSDTPFEVQNVKLWLSDGKNERELTAPWKMANTIIASGEEIRGVVQVPLKQKPTAKTRLRLRVEPSEPKRAVELGGLELK